MSAMSGGRLAAIILASLLGLLLVVGAGLAIAVYVFASQVEVTKEREDGREKVRVETPFRRVRVVAAERVEPDRIGIPIYPGARTVNDGGARVDVDLDLDFADRQLRMLAVELETDDSPDRVMEFYRRTAADFVLVQKNDDTFELRWERGRLKKIVGIEEKAGKTRISLAKIGEAEAN